ncbi:hypothetical protein [Clostridium sardiniense]|uniref:hypothetical protein n=1 Tax=Clostridium sardiniense TaxID=29369 RepID=UPI003D34845F
MRIYRKQRNSIKRIVSLVVLLLMIFGCIITPKITNAADNNNVVSQNIDENGIIEIPLSWSSNNMNRVNSTYDNDYNSSGISADYFDNIFNTQNILNSPQNAKAVQKHFWGKWYYTNEPAKTGATLRTEFMMENDNNYTIDYSRLESWFEGSNKGDTKPYNLPQVLNWNSVNGTAQKWNQSTPEDYTTQDWNLFRGIADLSGINTDDYEFYLAAPKSHAMFIGANDLISVFVDEMTTDINFATYRNSSTPNKEINFIDGNGVNNKLEFKREYWGTRDHNSCVAENLDKYNSIIDGWHVDLNDSIKDKSGNVILGDVTKIIQSNRYKNSKHAIDLLTSEWCNNGGVTKLALYAVKKPTIDIQKIAYVKQSDIDKINKDNNENINIDSKYILKREDSTTNGKSDTDIILKTHKTDADGNRLKSNDGKYIQSDEIPEVPANLPIYFKFKVTANNSTINNITLNDNDNDMNIKFSKEIKELKPNEPIIIKDEENLKFQNTANNYTDLNKVFNNTVSITGKYFNNQLSVSNSDSVKIKTKTDSPIKIDVYKDLVSINNVNVDYNKNPVPLVMGDVAKFKITIKNETLNGDTPIYLNNLELKDELNYDNGEKVLYSENTDKWIFLNDKNERIDPKNITLSPNEELSLYAECTVPDVPANRGINGASIYYNGEKIAYDRVDFNIKEKTGTIKVTKKVNQKFDKNKSQYSELSENDKEAIKNQLFTINVLDKNDGSTQSVAIKSGETAQFTGLKYKHSYVVTESIPMNYKLESINGDEAKSYTFTMGSDTDNTDIIIDNAYSDDGWFEFGQTIVNKLKTALNI